MLRCSECVHWSIENLYNKTGKGWAKCKFLSKDPDVMISMEKSYDINTFSDYGCVYGKKRNRKIEIYPNWYNR